MPIKLIAAPHTPFDGQGRLNVQAIPAQARHLRDQQVSGVFVCGSTGEGQSLSTAERRAVAATWCDAGREHGLDVIVHVGGNQQNEAIELAADAQECGASGVSSMAPYYHRPASIDELSAFLAPIAAAAGKLPFYYYDIPVMTGVQLPSAGLLSESAIPSLAGVKFTNPDLSQLQECLRVADGKYEVWFGCDEALLAAYALGVRGAVGSTYNFAAPLYHSMIEAYDQHDAETARDRQFDAVRLIRELARGGYLPASKWLLGQQGVDVGTVRPPLQSLSTRAMEELATRLQSLGILDNSWRIQV